MKKALKWILITALILFVLGGVLFLIGFATSGFDIGFLSTTKAVTREYREGDVSIARVKIDYENTDIRIVFDENATALSISYPVMQNNKGEDVSEVTVAEDGNAVSLTERSIWHKTIFRFNLSEPMMTVTLPATRSYQLDIELDNGEISVSGDGTFTTLSIDTDNGELDTTRATITAERLAFSMDNGEITLGIISADRAEIELDNGEIDLCGAFTVGTAVLDLDNGEINMEDAVVDCMNASISVDNGGIHGNLVGTREDYTIALERPLGECNVTAGGSGARKLSLSLDNGEIEIAFVGNK